MNKKGKLRLEKREILFKKQRKERGWDDSDTWSLYSLIAKYIVPRLKRFKEVKCGYPDFFGFPTQETNEKGLKKWDKILDDMIYAMEIYSSEEIYYESKLGKTDWKRVDRGCRLLGKHFKDLWW